MADEPKDAPPAPAPAAAANPAPAAATPASAGTAKPAAAAAPAAAKPAAKPAEPEKKTPPDESPVYRRVKAAMPEALDEDSHLHMGDLVLKAKLSHVLDLCRFLRDDPEMRFDYLSSVTAIDWKDRPKRFEMIWTLTSIPYKRRFNLAADVTLEEAEGDKVPSVRPIWRTADWQEREAYDMFGIRFHGHPDLRRILLPTWWEGFPLRKDYPLEGRGEHEKVVEECLRPRQ